MTVTTLVPPAAEPVTLSEARDYLRIAHGGEDGQITRLVASARARIETMAGLALIERTLRVHLETWPAGVLESRRISLPVRPATALLAVRVHPLVGPAADVTGQFRLEPGRAGRLVWTSGVFPWPGRGGAGVEIDYVAGFGLAPGDVSEALRLAVLRLAAHAYHRREADTLGGPLPEDVAGLLSPWRRVRL
jgi:uncharacterized phiE125 gp8 family phage protein